MKFLKFLIGLCFGLLMILIPLSQFQVSAIEPLQTLAVQLDGRKKPLDTAAHETVARVHGRPSYQPRTGEKLDSLQTYLSLIFNDRDWNQEPFILLSYRPLKEKIGLDRDRQYFTFEELIQSDLGSIVLAARQKQAANLDLTREEREALTLEEREVLMLETVGTQDLPLIPHPDDLKGTWVGLARSPQYYAPAQITPLLASYETLQQVYRAQPNDEITIAHAAHTLHEQLAALSPHVYPNDSLLQREVRFNHWHPFAKAWKLYALAWVVMLWVVLWAPFDFYWGAMGIFTCGLLIQAYGFIERMQIAGRPPVTNMYESAVWVGFGIAAIALLFELTHRAQFYLIAAAPLSILCLLLADNLPAVLDSSIQPLVPVLRDNFWLSVHVPTITLSYASFALAFGLAHILLGHYLFAPQAKNRIRNLSRWNYSILQVGVLLLATGIILGGIWAHFSWGRFWGWDPKETWALIALMCYIIPLHGRLVGWLGDFGMAVTSAVSFNAVLMAWYGVNFVLGKGLHSYGFSTGGSELIVGSIVAADLLFVLAVAAQYKGWFGAQRFWREKHGSS
jgi:cytochrome c-type biogenesis protein CcsB